MEEEIITPNRVWLGPFAAGKVDRMNVDHPAMKPPQVILAECRVRRLRRGGPGGQHRNKVETAVVLEHLPTGLRAEANERRSQAENQVHALRRLRVSLALGVRTPAASVASDLWKTYCSGNNDDFPALLAEALDVVHSHGYDAAAAAAHLGVSTSQLVKFVAVEPRALGILNEQRRLRGLSALRG